MKKTLINSLEVETYKAQNGKIMGVFSLINQYKKC
jgi:hypothetical protein